MVSNATIPAKIASTGTGARRISSSTTGISTTAVAIRFSKGIFSALKIEPRIHTDLHGFVRGFPCRSVANSEAFQGTRNYNQSGSRGRVFPLCTPGSGFYEFCGSVIEAAVAALALLIFRNALEKVKAAKIRPESCGHIDLGIGQLPEEEIAEPHLARRAH